MLVFLDFEASSLDQGSYPIEVAWVYEDGYAESYLIRPAPGWTDWNAHAEAIHHISRTRLEEEGTAHDLVAGRMVEALSGHDLLASAPSWDGKWLSALLRAAGLPRHRLRLRHSADAREACARAILSPVMPRVELDAAVLDVLRQAAADATAQAPAHRALPDAQAERLKWLAVRAAASAVAARISAQGPSCMGSVPGSGTS
jgi:hypothetical protein